MASSPPCWLCHVQAKSEGNFEEAIEVIRSEEVTISSKEELHKDAHTGEMKESRAHVDVCVSVYVLHQ